MSLVTEEVVADWDWECGCGEDYGGEGACGCKLIYKFKKRDLQVNIC